MKRIFITGSTDGLGLAAARVLMAEGHDVVLHARSKERAGVLADITSRSGGAVIGDLSSAKETRSVADQVNKIGRMDVVIHNAGIYQQSTRAATAEGHARILAVNVLAPYVLTALMPKPDRLIYLSSGMHRNGSGPLQDIDWTTRRWDNMRAYCESKLYISAFAVALSRRWPEVLSNSVDPGWVPTKMGGPSASDDLEKGHLTQTWLAASDDPAAKISGGYWHHRKQQQPAAEVLDHNFQDQLLAELAKLTGVSLP
jgi:NAD(P)-dependent dehydrogenase (short-subunit alcohol dehydrogenase family)